MERWSNKVALVTGASAGIGASICTKLVENGLHVVGLARRSDKLQELSSELQNRKLPGKFYPIKADITVEEDVVRAIGWVQENLEALHVLVNNAGIAKPATLLNGSTQMFREVLETNVLGLSIVTREALKVMQGTEEGHVIHINSGAGHKVIDFPLNVYFGSKFAVTALAQSLRMDLKREKISHIRVTSLSPGLVDTDIINAFKQIEPLEKIIEEAPKLTPEDVANGVVYVLGTPKHLEVTELSIQPRGSA